jgi:hypothetical protein
MLEQTQGGTRDETWGTGERLRYNATESHFWWGNFPHLHFQGGYGLVLVRIGSPKAPELGDTGRLVPGVRLSVNPYAAPSAELQGVVDLDPTEAVRDRQAHLSTERGLRSMGALYLFTAALGLVVFVSMMAAMVPAMVALAGGGELHDTSGLGLVAVFVVFYGALSAVSIWVGLGLRKRNPTVRIPATVMAVFSLASFPIGTALGVYLLVLLWSAKGKRVFQPDYDDIIAATPHLVVRTSPLVWVVAGMLLLSLVAVILLGMFA